MIAYDIAIVIGLGCVTYAGYLVHPACAWCVGGLALSLFGFLGARNKLGGKKK